MRNRHAVLSSLIEAVLEGQRREIGLLVLILLCLSLRFFLCSLFPVRITLVDDVLLNI
jgi:hypothetical protein